MSKSGSSKQTSNRSIALVLVGVLGIIVVGIVVIYALSQQDSDSSPEVQADATPTPTSIVIPTEPPQEADLQQQLRDWFMTVTGVSQVLSLDVDIPDNELPLIYAELDVALGYNNTNIPATFVAKVNESLNVTQYSDFVVILNDGTQIIEYTLNPENNMWNQTVLSNQSTSE